MLAGVFPDAQSEGATSHNVVRKLIMFVYSTLCVACGGYVTAWLARGSEVRHAVIMGAIQMALTVLAMIEFHDKAPLWFWIVGIVVTVPAAWCGGILRVKMLDETITVGNQRSSRCDTAAMSEDVQAIGLRGQERGDNPMLDGRYAKGLARSATFASVQPLLAYAAANLDDDVSLTALAGKASLSAFYLHRIFSAAVGETPKQFTMRLRLGHAAARLLMTDDSVLSVALSCGFQSHEVFVRAFRRSFGMTPSTYRRRGFANRVSTTQARQHAALVSQVGPCIALYHIDKRKEPEMTLYHQAKGTFAPASARDAPACEVVRDRIDARPGFAECIQARPADRGGDRRSTIYALR